MNTTPYRKKRKSTRYKTHEDGSLNIQATILAMKIGDTVNLGKTANVPSIRVTVTRLSQIYGRKFTVSALWNEDVTIERIA